MHKIPGRFLRWSGRCLLLSLSGCVPAPYLSVFLRNTAASPVVVWLTAPVEMVNGLPRPPGLYREGRYHHTLLYAPTLLRPTPKNVERMHDSLAVSCVGATLKFIVPPHATVWLGTYYRWGKQAFRPELNSRRQSIVGLGNVGYDVLHPELKLQRADSVMTILKGPALAKVAHTNSVGAHVRLWLDI